MPHLELDIKLDFKDVLLRPKRSTLKSRSDVDLTRELTFRNSNNTFKGIPIIASNMDTVGTFQMAKAFHKHNLFTCAHKFYKPDDFVKFFEDDEINNDNNSSLANSIAVSLGIGNEDTKRLKEILRVAPVIKYVCLDVANGYTEQFVDCIRLIREDYQQKLTIIAGNVVTGEMSEEILLSGADIVKVGIGGGSVCTTRKKTGVGYPQLSAILECSDAAHGLKGRIISDGGCTCPGDVAKAFGAGADFVMLGGMLAGHDQSGGNVIEKNGKKYKAFYGMSSATAMKKHYGSMASYRSSEGKTVEILYRGDVEDTIKDVLGGLRSACTYVGAVKLKELSKRTTFIRVSQQTNETFSGYDVGRS